MAFVPEHAPLVVLTSLGTGLLLAAAGAGLVLGLVTGRRRLVGCALAVLVVAGASYSGALLALSLTSENKTLTPGEWKYFCEVDCHLAYRVESVATTKTVGATEARGTFYLVTLKTWFDERTIASWRPKDLPLTPAPRALALVDEQGRCFEVSADGQRALAQAGAAGAPLTQPLKPGESYTTTLVFDLPDDAHRPRLLLTTTGAPTYFLLGHENSFFHRKVFFRLPVTGAR